VTISPLHIGNHSFNPDDELLLQQIGDLFSGSPVPEQVLPEFDRLVQNLIPFDRLVIAVYLNNGLQSELVHISGDPIESFTPGTQHFQSEEVVRDWIEYRRGITNLDPDSVPGVKLVRSLSLDVDKYGFKSWMFVPIIWQDEMIGELLLRSYSEDAFQGRELEVADFFVKIIAGTVASVRAISEARHESMLRKNLLSLSRVISSVQSLEDVDEKFGEIILDISDSYRVSVTRLIDSDNKIVNMLVIGDDIPILSKGKEHSLARHNGPLWMHEKSAYLSEHSLQDSFGDVRWADHIAFENGLQSFMAAPIIWQGKNIAGITFRSKNPNNFTSAHLDIANAIADQIAGTIANQIALKESIAATRERDLLAQISRVITTTQGIDDNFEELAELIDKLIPSERFSLFLEDPKTGIPVTYYSRGRALANLAPGELPPAKSEITDLFKETRTAQIIDTNTVGIEHDFAISKKLSDPVGLNSWLIAPVFWRNEMIASLHFRAEKPEAYSDSSLRIADEIATQISSLLADVIAYNELVIEAARRDALATIGRTITSSENLDDTFEVFAESVSKLIPWDRISITTPPEIDPTDSFVFQAGISYELNNGNEMPYLIRDLVSAFAEDPTPIIVGDSLRAKYSDLRKSENLSKSIGLNSWLLVPLIWQNEQIGHIHIRSKQVNAYDSSHIDLAIQISNQISGAIAGNLAKAELTREVAERAALADMSRALASSQLISDNFDQFSQIVRTLIPADRVSVSRFSEDGRRFFPYLVNGLPLIGLDKPRLSTLQGDITDIIKQHDSPVILSDLIGLTSQDFVSMTEIAEASGFHSWLVAPMHWRGELIGTLHFRAIEENAYSDREVKIAGDIASQVVGLIASSTAFEELEHEAKIRDVLAVISRVVSDSDDFANVLPQIEELTSTVIDFNGFSIGAFDSERQTIRRLYAHGMFDQPAGMVDKSDNDDDKASTDFPISQSAASGAIIGRKTESLSFESADEISEFPRSIEAFEGGTRTFLTAALISNDRVVGAMQVRSSQENAYSDSDIRILERIAGQIAGSLANTISTEKNRLQAVALEAADNAIMICTSDGIIEWSNSAFTRLTGWTPVEAIGQPTSIMRSVNPDNWVKDEQIWASVRRGKSWNGIRTSRKKDGSEYPEELLITPVLGNDGELAHMIGIRQDVTDRLMAEEAHENSLRIESENRELQRLAAARSEFLSTVSHELRTPLTTVSAFADILFKSKSENLTERQKHHVELIRKSSTQLGSLIDDLLDISQADTGRLALNKNDFEVAKMIDEIGHNAAVLIAARDQTLEIVNVDPSVCITADRSRVIQIISNMLTNASKFSGDRSNIRLEIKATKKKIFFSVIDQGSGISKADQAMMFSPFYRGASNKTSQPDGRGLGLAVVRSLVDLHDGSISVSSKNGVGTTMTVTLPGVTSGSTGK
jgi:PAS domain S-box-containing protein